MKQNKISSSTYNLQSLTPIKTVQIRVQLSMSIRPSKVVGISFKIETNISLLDCTYLFVGVNYPNFCQTLVRSQCSLRRHNLYGWQCVPSCPTYAITFVGTKIHSDTVVLLVALIHQSQNMAYLSLPYGKFSSLSDLHYQCKLLCRGRGQQLLLGSLKLLATSSCLCWAILSITIVDEIFVSSFMGLSLIVGNFSYTASHAS